MPCRKCVGVKFGSGLHSIRNTVCKIRYCVHVKTNGFDDYYYYYWYYYDYYHYHYYYYI